MNTRLHSLSGPLFALALLAAPNTDLADCGNAADRYTVAVGRVIDALHSYDRCVSHSAKRDDCAAEMQALDDAHDAFADTVADLQGCR